MKRYFVFSDVHGCYDALMNGLNNSGFDLNNNNHIILSLGDNFDRGNHNFEVYQFLKSIPKDRRILLRGNHEVMLKMLLERKSITASDKLHGTANTYYQLASNLDDIAIEDVVELMSEMTNYFELGDFIFTHAFIPDDYKNATQDDWDEAVWINSFKRLSTLPKINKTIVVGHRFSSFFHGIDEIYIKDGVCGLIAIDSRTIVSCKVNILVIEEDGKIINERKGSVLKQIL